MKNSGIRGESGMTLLEVIMACVILPVMIFGATTMMMGLARVSSRTNTGMDLLMTTDTLFLRFEKDLFNVKPSSASGVDYPRVAWGAGFIELQTSATTGYRYNLATRTLVDQSGVVYSGGGILWPDAPLEDYNNSGAIDGVDIARRNTCLNAMTQALCHDLNVNAVFAVSAVDRRRPDFRFRSEKQKGDNQYGFLKSILLTV